MMTSHGQQHCACHTTVCQTLQQHGNHTVSYQQSIGPNVPGNLAVALTSISHVIVVPKYPMKLAASIGLPSSKVALDYT